MPRKFLVCFRSSGWAAGLRLLTTLAVLVLAGVALAGCTSPPSVVPLLEVAEQAVVQEAEQLTADGQRDQQWFDQTREALEQAYAADLAQREALEPAWVGEATRGYVLSREELLRHELALQRQRRQRSENLEAAAEAMRRAGAILEQRDRLIRQTVGQPAERFLRDALQP